MKPSVLIVEDEWLIFSEIADLVKDCGFEPLGPCKSRAQVVKIANRIPPDLALVDIRLEKELGHEICGYLHQHYRTACVFITGSLDAALIERRGALGILLKPFGTGELKQVLEYMMSARTNGAGECPACLLRLEEFKS